METTFTREELYKLVWSTPLLALSKKYFISDNGLRKMCIRMNIPLPKAGHWMKIQFGRKVIIKPLSTKHEGETTVRLRLREEDDPPAPHNELNRRVQEIKTALGSKLIVPEKLKMPDKLIVAARKQLAANGWYDPYTYKKVIGCGREVLDVRIGKQSLKRSLLFLDTFIKAIQARNHRIFFKYDDTTINVNGQEYKINFREKMSRTTVPATYGTKMELHPSGILSFRIDSYRGREWKDGKEKIENKIAEIIAKLEMISDEETLEDNQREDARKIRELEERLVKELKLRQEQELLDFKSMLSKADRWHKAVNLRNYINEVERLGNAGKLSEWLEWARKKADWFDPFIAAKDELLENVDVDVLEFKKHF